MQQIEEDIDFEETRYSVMKIVYNHEERDRIFEIEDAVEFHEARNKFVEDCRKKFEELNLKGKHSDEGLFELGWGLRGYVETCSQRRFGVHMWQSILGDRFNITLKK